MTREEREIIEAIKIMGYNRTAYPKEKVSAVINMAIEALQSREQGEWVDDGCVEKCDKCGERREFPHWNFCPNCGARMKGGTE